MRLFKAVLSLSVLALVIATISGCTAPANPGSTNAAVYANPANGTPVSQ